MVCLFESPASWLAVPGIEKGNTRQRFRLLITVQADYQPTSPPLSSGPSTAIATRLPRSASSADLTSPNDAATKLAEAIDDFLGDLEKKFKGISDEILTKREFPLRPLSPAPDERGIHASAVQARLQRTDARYLH
jgi:hypothetical protein